MPAKRDLLLNIPPSDISGYSQPTEVFRSWFWRFYDHYFRLILLNFLWFISCYGTALLFFRSKFEDFLPKESLFKLYLFFILENIVSIGWAFLVFKIFISQEESFKNVWVGFKKYLLKAGSISAVSGLIVVLAIYNIRFYWLMDGSHRFVDYLSMCIVIWILFFWSVTLLYQWPVLFFQNPSFFDVFYRSCLLTIENIPFSLGITLFFVIFLTLFSIVWVLWIFIGFVFFFSFQCVLLEKQLLKHKITYQGQALSSFLKFLDGEKRRSWREILKPWENR